jgi:hypothetical protein
MSSLGLQPREVWKQPSRLPAEGRLGSSENTSEPRRCLFFVACLAPFEYLPVSWHSEPSHLRSPSVKFQYAKAVGVSILSFNQYYTVVLKTFNEDMFFISAMPSEDYWFKFMVSWPSDDHTSAEPS